MDLLSPLESVYRAGWGIWNWGYSQKIFPSYPVKCTVISIGNLTWGGTGKTPVVKYLAQRFKEKGERVGVLSRGYGSPDDRLKADEVRWLMDQLQGVSIFADPDRVASAKEAQAQGIDCLILDDGFQHRRLVREMDIITMDATDPFGNGYLIPAGKLREPLSSLRRADWVLLTKSDLVSSERLHQIQGEIRRVAPGVPMSETIYRPVGLSEIPLKDGASAHQRISTLVKDRHRNLEQLQGKKVGLVAAIGNPEGFKRTVEKLGAIVVRTYFKRDHSRYSELDFQRMAEIQENESLFGWITTSKDGARIKSLMGGLNIKAGNSKPEIRNSKPEIQDRKGIIPTLCELAVELVFTKGEAELWQAIESLF